MVKNSKADTQVLIIILCNYFGINNLKEQKKKKKKKKKKHRHYTRAFVSLDTVHVITPDCDKYLQ